MQGENLVFHAAGQKKIQSALKLLGGIARALSKPQSVALTTSPNQGFSIVDDGEKLLGELPIQDKFEAIVIKMIGDAAAKTKRVTGGGNYLTILLCEAIFDAGLKFAQEGGDLTLFRKKLDEEILVIESKLKEGAIPLAIEELSHAAGRDSPTVFDMGYVSPYLMLDGETSSCLIDNPLIFVTDQKITKAEEMSRILKLRGEEALVIVATAIDVEALETLLLNKIKGSLKISAVQVPVGEEGRKMLRDLAALSQATLVSRELGLSLNDLDPKLLGRLREVHIDSRRVTVKKEGGDIAVKIMSQSEQGVIENKDNLGNLFEHIDFPKFTRVAVISEALRNAVSITGLLLSSEGLVST